MAFLNTSRIIAADRLNDAIVVTFSDGRTGLFSAALLYAVLGQAKEFALTEREDKRKFGALEP